MAAAATMTTTKTTPPSHTISRETLALAIRALLKWIKSQSEHKKAQLFGADDIIYLIVTLTRIPAVGRTNPHRIPIPHPIHPFDVESTDICLIVDDRPSSPLLPSAALDQIRACNLPIAKVIGLSDLKSDYRPFESRRKLCDSHNLFFADRKIIPLLPRLLGNHFFRRKKIPLAVDLSRVGWVEQIRSYCDASLLYLRTGTCCGLKIGRITQSEDEIVENALAAVDGAMKYLPKKWGNVRSVHVKTVDSIALPVYQAVPGIGLKIETEINGGGGGVSVKGKKRARDEKKKKGKKGRIHEAGVEGKMEEEEEDSGEGRDVISNEDANVEEGEKKKQKKEGKKKKINMTKAREECEKQKKERKMWSKRKKATDKIEKIGKKIKKSTPKYEID